MRDDEGRFFCDHCKRRCARGGLRVKGIRDITSRRVATNDDSSIFCSDTCLRDALWGLAPDDDPAEVLRRRLAAIESGERERRRTAREDSYAAELEARLDEMQAMHNQVRETVQLIRDEELTRAIDQSDKGKQLRRCLDAIQRHIPLDPKTRYGYGIRR